jgi:DNA-binding NtrC family response regulator
VEKEVHHQEYEVEDHDDITRFFNEREEIPSIEEAEKFLIQKALTKFDGNRRKAADTLGMSERTLYRKIDQYNLA